MVSLLAFTRTPRGTPVPSRPAAKPISYSRFSTPCATDYCTCVEALKLALGFRGIIPGWMVQAGESVLGRARINF